MVVVASYGQGVSSQRVPLQGWRVLEDVQAEGGEQESLEIYGEWVMQLMEVPKMEVWKMH